VRAKAASAGDPNDGLADPGVAWPAYEPARRTQLRFGDDGVETTGRVVGERLEWWRGVSTSDRTDPWGRAIEAASGADAAAAAG
jgi:para-nitrobenzyl esterase